MRGIENVLILSGDHLYRMDYMDFVQVHIFVCLENLMFNNPFNKSMNGLRTTTVEAD
jgi:Nucleotidyl transferase